MDCTCGHGSDDHVPLKDGVGATIGWLECRDENCRCIQFVRSNL